MWLVVLVVKTKHRRIENCSVFLLRMKQRQLWKNFKFLVDLFVFKLEGLNTAKQVFSKELSHSLIERRVGQIPMRKHNNVHHCGFIALEHILKVIKFKGSVYIERNSSNCFEHVGSYIKPFIFAAVTVDIFIFWHEIVNYLLQFEQIVQK